MWAKPVQPIHTWRSWYIDTEKYWTALPYEFHFIAKHSILLYTLTRISGTSLSTPYFSSICQLNSHQMVLQACSVQPNLPVVSLPMNGDNSICTPDLFRIWQTAPHSEPGLKVEGAMDWLLIWKITGNGSEPRVHSYRLFLNHCNSLPQLEWTILPYEPYRWCCTGANSVIG